MQIEEVISLNEYCRRYKMGPERVKQLIAKKEIDYFVTDKGYYKIRVGGDTVSRELYEAEKQKRIEAETTINILKSVLLKYV